MRNRQPGSAARTWLARRASADLAPPSPRLAVWPPPHAASAISINDAATRRNRLLIGSPDVDVDPRWVGQGVDCERPGRVEPDHEAKDPFEVLDATHLE